MHEHRLVGLAVLLLLGISSQWLAWRLRLPSILLLLLSGFIVGPIAKIFNPEHPLLDPDFVFGGLLFPVVSLAVALILFEGGLSLRLAELRDAGGVLWRLLTLGTIATWFISTVAAHFILGAEWGLATLIGAVLVVTGPTVVGPLLRHVRPTQRVATILKWEGIAIDPVGATLTVLIYEALVAGNAINAPLTIALGVLRTLFYGTAVGVVAAVFLIAVLRRFWIPDNLQNPVVIATVAGAFVFANHLQTEAGLLTVTLMGLGLANQNVVSVRHIVEFKENLRVLLISGLFVLLAARLGLGEFQRIGWEAISFLLVLFFIARPACVFLSTIGSGLNMQQRLFLSWMAPRGIVAAAVASIFQLRLQEVDYPQADLLVPVTIVVIVGTVLIYGLTAMPVAQHLKVARPAAQGILIAGAHSWARDMAKVLRNNGVSVLLVDTNEANVDVARAEGLEAQHASILSEAFREEAAHGDYGKLLAMTSNDEVNSLACLQFIELFGRSEVYQLATKALSATHHESVALHHRGRILFEAGVTFSRLRGLHERGANLETSPLSAEANSKKMRSESQNESAINIPLFLVNGKGNVQVVTAEKWKASRTTPTLVSLVCPTATLDVEKPAATIENELQPQEAKATK